MKEKRQERLTGEPGYVYQCLQFPLARAVFAVGGTSAPSFPFPPLNASFFALGKALNEERRQGIWVTQRKGEDGAYDRRGSGWLAGELFLAVSAWWYVLAAKYYQGEIILASYSRLRVQYIEDLRILSFM